MFNKVSIRYSHKRLRDNDEYIELVMLVAGFIIVVAAVSYGQMYKLKEVS